MPISPENRCRYPKNWPEITDRIKGIAGNRCAWCGLRNGAIGYRLRDASFVEIEQSHAGDINADDARENGYRVIKIVLTVAHMDHQPENCNDDNLKALCQQCHNRYDAKERKHNRQATRQKKQLKML